MTTYSGLDKDEDGYVIVPYRPWRTKPEVKGFKCGKCGMIVSSGGTYVSCPSGDCPLGLGSKGVLDDPLRKFGKSNYQLSVQTGE